MIKVNMTDKTSREFIFAVERLKRREPSDMLAIISFIEAELDRIRRENDNQVGYQQAWNQGACQFGQGFLDKIADSHETIKVFKHTEEQSRKGSPDPNKPYVTSF